MLEIFLGVILFLFSEFAILLLEMKRQKRVFLVFRFPLIISSRKDPKANDPNSWTHVL